ncbi:hypothetical protein F4861DRAFT_354262 [Xylaria intraflava]|nr:hypothetical protein F4861DRAFT_354262 [Xylaria intraflava]
MGDASPPKRMTRARAAAAARTTTSTKSTPASQSNKVSKSTKVTKSTAVTTAAPVKAAAKPAAAKSAAKPAAKTAAKSTAKSTATKPTAAGASSGVTDAEPAGTRSAAAAKSTAATKASAAKSAATAATSTRLALKKRKVRNFDSDDEDDLSKEDNTQYTMNRPAKKLRGPAKKAAAPQPSPEPQSSPEPQEKEAQDTTPTISSEPTSATATTTSSPTSTSAPSTITSTSSTTAASPPARATRGRAKRSAATVAATALKKQTPAKISHSRTRKSATKSDDASTTAAEEPVKKTTRARSAKGTITTTYDTEPTPGLKSAVSRPASKIDGGLKKTVTFEEPEKENILPQATAATGSNSKPTGMRAKPVRKPTTSGRITRASARAATEDVTEKKPLSPKKDVQNRPLSRDASSDDELATYEKTPLKPLMESPIRPSTNISKVVPASEEDKDESSPQPPMPGSASVFSSPARRPPLSPFKDAMKSPAKRVDGVPSLLFPAPSVEVKGAQSPSKSSILQSPAKRLQMPLQMFHQSSQDHTGTLSSPMKMSLLNTPAKRPASSITLFGSPVPQTEEKPQETPKEIVSPPMEELNEEQLQYQIREEIGLISPPQLVTTQGSPEPVTKVNDEDRVAFESPATPELALPGPLSAAESALETIVETDDKDSVEVETPTPQLAFPGRLSAILPRHADPTLTPQTPKNAGMSKSLNNELSVEAPCGDSKNLSEAATEEQSTNVCVGASLEESMDAYEDETTQEYVDAREDDTTSHSIDEDLNEAAEQPDEICAAETKEQTTDASMAKTNDQHMDACVPDSTDNCESKMEKTEEVCEAESKEETLDATIFKTNDHQADVCVPDLMDEPHTNTEEPEEARAEEPKEQASDMSVAETNDQHVDVGVPDLMKESESKTEEPAALSPTQTITTPAAPKQAGSGMQGYSMSDSEDELALDDEPVTKHQGDEKASDSVPSTSAPPLFKSTERKIPESAVRAASRAIRSLTRPNYTPLSMKLGAWRASSPIKPRDGEQTPTDTTDKVDDLDENSLLDEKDLPAPETPSLGFKRIFGGSDMRGAVDEETQAAMEAYVEAEIAAKFDNYDFNLTEEDLKADMEDDETSLPNTPEAGPSRLSSIPEATEEHDESTGPIDPALLSKNADKQADSLPPVTPFRPLRTKRFHTVSKVPLKPADDSTPRDTKRHCSTVSKASLHRPNGPLDSFPQTDEDSKHVPVTPSKSVGTPARMTRSDLNPTLLRGAVVYVDVHTTEGADAGRIFVDLLMSMGARCVKAWPWNPANSTDGELDAAKVGITHVVFKDGSKRTLEKVIESNGLVHCVGVSWVLDCEQENQWLSEKDYRVDTSLIPRGGHNRRKSMEPKAVANMNGTLVTPVKANTGLTQDPQTVPNNYMSRRDSTLWMRTPSEHDDDEDAPSEMDWEPTVLTPVPKTPAPETVARFAMDVTPGTPSTVAANPSPYQNHPLMQTCPPKPAAGRIIGLGHSFMTPEQERNFTTRLLEARRRTMQFAPKIASPLKKQWKHLD